MDIPLSVKGKSSLEESLQSFTAEEFLTGENQYEVEGKGKFDAIMCCKIKELPPILHFHLQRYDYSLGFEQKILSKFSFPLVLDMQYYLTEKKEAKYELISVLVHQGIAGGGHYFAYCRPTVKNEWFCFNDDHVEQCTQDEAIDRNFGGGESQTAYFLAYANQKHIEELMKPLSNDEISTELSTYYNDWYISKLGQTKRVRILIYDEKRIIDASNREGFLPINIPPIQTLSVTGNLIFKELLNQISKSVKINEEFPTIWKINEEGFPDEKINLDKEVQDYSIKEIIRIFVTAPVLHESIGAFLAIDKPFRIEGFYAVLPTTTIQDLELPIRIKYNLKDSQKLKAFLIRSGRIEIEVHDHSKSLSELLFQRGIIIFKPIKDETIGPIYSPAQI